MTTFFEVQKDYADLIHLAWHWLKPNGTILFSTNYRSFQLDPLLLPTCQIQSITEKTQPIDFRSLKIRQGWLLHRHPSN